MCHYFDCCKYIIYTMYVREGRHARACARTYKGISFPDFKVPLLLDCVGQG